jgi:hypothetical protein
MNLIYILNHHNSHYGAEAIVQGAGLDPQHCAKQKSSTWRYYSHKIEQDTNGTTAILLS